MAGVIEYPMNRVAADSLPRPGDGYEPYGLAAGVEPVTLSFVFPDWSKASFPYARMAAMQFEPLDGDEAGGGDGRISVFFEMTPEGGTLADIVGCNLQPCVSAMASQRLRWIWVLPEDRASLPEGSPVVRLVEFRHAARSDLYKLLAFG